MIAKAATCLNRYVVAESVRRVVGACFAQFTGVCSNVFEFLPKVQEAANNQKRIGFVDVSSWVMNNIKIEPLQEN